MQLLQTVTIHVLLLVKIINIFLVDAGGGNGILKQLEDSNIKPADIVAMFISHTHTDHIMGAVWIIRVIGRKYLVEDYKTPLIFMVTMRL